MMNANIGEHVTAVVLHNNITSRQYSSKHLTLDTSHIQQTNINKKIIRKIVIHADFTPPAIYSNQQRVTV